MGLERSLRLTSGDQQQWGSGWGFAQRLERESPSFWNASFDITPLMLFRFEADMRSSGGGHLESNVAVGWLGWPNHGDRDGNW